VLCSFVFCRQRQDERLRRGGEQKSVVLLSMYPYSSVLSPLCQYAGPLFFNYGHEALAEVLPPLQATRTFEHVCWHHVDMVAHRAGPGVPCYG
jgi:hypothetical protein